MNSDDLINKKINEMLEEVRSIRKMVEDGEKVKKVVDNLILNVSEFGEEPTRKIEPHKEEKIECPDGFEPFNEDWFLSPEGDMLNASEYYIPSDRLGEDDWILHCMGRNWFDANTYLPAFFEACRRAKIKVVKMRIDY